MKNSLKDFFVKNWYLKVIAFIISISLWAYVNFGNYAPIDVYKNVHIEHKDNNYTYTINPKDVVLRLLVVDRILNQKILKETKAYIDARTLKEGINIAKVNIKTPIPILMKPDISRSLYVKVLVKKKLTK